MHRVAPSPGLRRRKRTRAPVSGRRRFPRSHAAPVFPRSFRVVRNPDMNGIWPPRAMRTQYMECISCERSPEPTFPGSSFNFFDLLFAEKYKMNSVQASYLISYRIWWGAHPVRGVTEACTNDQHRAVRHSSLVRKKTIQLLRHVRLAAPSGRRQPQRPYPSNCCPLPHSRVRIGNRSSKIYPCKR